MLDILEFPYLPQPPIIWTPIPPVYSHHILTTSILILNTLGYVQLTDYLLVCPTKLWALWGQVSEKGILSDSFSFVCLVPIIVLARGR